MKERNSINFDDLICEFSKNKQHKDKDQLLKELHHLLDENYSKCETKEQKDKFVRSFHDALKNNKKIQDILTKDVEVILENENSPKEQFFLDIKEAEFANSKKYMEYLYDQIKEYIIPIIKIKKVHYIGWCGILFSLLAFLCILNTKYVFEDFIMVFLYTIMCVSFILYKYIDYFLQINNKRGTDKEFQLAEILYAYGIPFKDIKQNDFTEYYSFKNDAFIIAKIIMDRQIKN